MGEGELVTTTASNGLGGDSRYLEYLIVHASLRKKAVVRDAMMGWTKRSARRSPTNLLSNFMHLERMEKWTRMRGPIGDRRMRSSCGRSWREKSRT